MKPQFKLLILAAAGLTACGGGGGESPLPSSGSASASSSASSRVIPAWDNPFADTATETATLTVWAGETQDSVDFIRAVAQDFKKVNPRSNYTINVKPVSESSVSGDWASDPSNAADVAIAADDQIPSMISSNYIQDLEPLSKKAIPGIYESVKSRNTTDSVNAATDSGKLYGFPVSASNGYILYYNSDLIAKEDTTSFDKLLAAIARASEKDGVNYQFGFPYNSGWYLDGWFHGAGFNATGEAGKTTVDCNWNQTITDPAGNSVKGSDVAGALVKLAHGQYESHWTSAKQENIMTMIDKGNAKQVIATINGTWNYRRIAAAWGDGAAATTLPTYHAENGIDYGMQSVKGYKIAVVNRSRSKTILPAARFAEFLTNYSSQIIRFDSLSEAPTNTESTKQCDFETNACVKALNEQWQKGAFVEKVNEAFWNPSNGLSTQLCEGTSGTSFIASGKGTANIVLNTEAIQVALDACVASFQG